MAAGDVPAQALFCECESFPSSFCEGQSALPASVRRRPPRTSAAQQIRPVARSFREKDDERSSQTACKSGVRPLRPPGSSAVPARVACQARFASAGVVPRQGRPSSPPGSPAKLLLRVYQNAGRRPRQGRSPAPPGSPAKLFEGRLGPARVLVLGDIRRLVLRVAPPGCPPGWPGECQRCAVPAAIARQTSITHRLGSTVRACFVECVVGRLRRVVRGPRQGRPPFPPGWPAKLVLRVPALRTK